MFAACTFEKSKRLRCFKMGFSKNFQLIWLAMKVAEKTMVALMAASEFFESISVRLSGQCTSPRQVWIAPGCMR